MTFDENGNMASIRHGFTLITSWINSNYSNVDDVHSFPASAALITPQNQPRDNSNVTSYGSNYETRKPHINLNVVLTKRSDLYGSDFFPQIKMTCTQDRIFNGPFTTLSRPISIIEKSLESA